MHRAELLPRRDRAKLLPRRDRAELLPRRDRAKLLPRRHHAQLLPHRHERSARTTNPQTPGLVHGTPPTLHSRHTPCALTSVAAALHINSVTRRKFWFFESCTGKVRQSMAQAAKVAFIRERTSPTCRWAPASPPEQTEAPCSICGKASIVHPEKQNKPGSHAFCTRAYYERMVYSTHLSECCSRVSSDCVLQAVPLTGMMMDAQRFWAGVPLSRRTCACAQAPAAAVA